MILRSGTISHFYQASTFRLVNDSRLLHPVFVCVNYCYSNGSTIHAKQLELEAKWIYYIRQHDNEQNKKWMQGNSGTVRRSYILSMFPYPSGTLHLGHLRVYTVADVLARYKAMRGFAVLQPMGWDAFGLPAENAAIDRGILPALWTSENTQEMRKQMEANMLLSFDWSREISTCDPSYYKWTQWIFLKLYNAGLAYRRSAFVNWDPVDQTVLADELVDAHGRSWRSGAVVKRIPLRQWYFRTSVYSQSLLDGLKDIEGNQWRDVIQMQRGWLGNLDGTQIEFDVLSSSASIPEQSCTKSISTFKERLTVFTREPHLVVADLVSYIGVTEDSVYFADCYRMPEKNRGANYSRKLLLFCSSASTPEFDSRKLNIVSTTSVCPWAEKLAISVMHPFTGRSVPMVRLPGIHIPQSVAFPDLIRTVLDTEAESVTKLLDLPTPPGSVSSHKTPKTSDAKENSVLVSPLSELNGLSCADGLPKAMELLKKAGRGGYWSSESRTDWLISRQRYWGTPIPMVHCQSCGVVPVPEDELPVTLPPLTHAFKRGAVPLKDDLQWRKTTCPKCGGVADRETDTLDTFVDSSWYFLRYLDPRNSSEICDSHKARIGLPVDVYVGGIEHAIRHLYYARFISHFLHDAGVMPCREPFLRFLPIGLVLGQTFMESHSGRYVPPSHVKKTDAKPGQVIWTEKDSGQLLNMQWDKMSKSKLNGVDPTEVVRRHGMELVRLTMLANVGPHRARKWQENDGVMRGIVAWQSKLLSLGANLLGFGQDQASCGGWQLMYGPQNDPLWNEDQTRPHFKFRSAHQHTVQLVNSYFDESFVLSAAISRLQETTEMLRRATIPRGGPGPRSFLYLRVLADLIVMLTPLAPILSCELWSNLVNAYKLQPPNATIHDQLNALRDSQSSWAVHWPYDITKSVLDQPFPFFTDLGMDDVSTPSILSSGYNDHETVSNRD